MQDESASALIEWIHSARLFGEKAGLDNMFALCEKLGHPERSFRSVHIAGTNGKGSVCAMVERVVRDGGYKTGLYTSPYLMAYNERMCINGAPVSDALLVECGNSVREAAVDLAQSGVRPTSFELGTAIAFVLFAREHVDLAVIETGLGGRLDPTNVIMPLACAIATIGYDHMAVLGDTLEQIASEKAGIIKEGAPVALYPQSQSVARVFEETARRRNAPLYAVSAYSMRNVRMDAYGGCFDIHLPSLGEIHARIALPGAHQLENARLALTLLDILNGRGLSMRSADVERGMALARWPGRLEWVDGLLLDGAHNPEGARVLSEYLLRYFGNKRICLLTGMMRDKQPETCAKILGPLCTHVITTKVDWPRAMPAQELAELYATQGIPTRAVANVADALDQARSTLEAEDLLIVAGSLYLVGAVRAQLTAR